MPIQSVIIPKYFGLQKSLAWLKKHGFRFKKIDIKENFYRFRQLQPKFKRYSTQKLSNGVELIIGY